MIKMKITVEEQENGYMRMSVETDAETVLTIAGSKEHEVVYCIQQAMKTIADYFTTLAGHGFSAEGDNAPKILDKLTEQRLEQEKDKRRF